MKPKALVQVLFQVFKTEGIMKSVLFHRGKIRKEFPYFSMTVFMSLPNTKGKASRKAGKGNRDGHGIEHQSIFAKEEQLGIKMYWFNVQCLKFKKILSVQSYKDGRIDGLTD